MACTENYKLLSILLSWIEKGFGTHFEEEKEWGRGKNERERRKKKRKDREKANFNIICRKILKKYDKKVKSNLGYGVYQQVDSKLSSEMVDINFIQEIILVYTFILLYLSF